MLPPVPVNNSMHLPYISLQQSNLESLFKKSIHVINLLLILHLIETVLGGIECILFDSFRYLVNKKQDLHPNI